MLEQLLDEIIHNEGKKETNRPNDSGGRTKYGISERWHPEEWVNGPPTLERAKEIYLHQYIIGPKIHMITPDYLMFQVADFGVPSGPAVAIRHLQRILNVDADGEIGPLTLEALSKRDPEKINNLLVKSRVLMFSRLVQKRPKDLENLYGWNQRAFSFLR